MAIGRILRQPATIFRRTEGVDDKYGNITVSYVADAEPVRAYFGTTDGSSSTELLTSRDTVVTVKPITILGHVELTAGDRIRDDNRDVLYDVTGEPDFPESPNGRLKVTVGKLRRVFDV